MSPRHHTASASGHADSTASNATRLLWMSERSRTRTPPRYTRPGGGRSRPCRPGYNACEERPRGCMSRLSQLGEFGLIARLDRVLREAGTPTAESSARLLLGIG